MCLEADLTVGGVVRGAERTGYHTHLSASDFVVFSFLAPPPRLCFGRQHLLDRVWHYEYFGDSNTVTVHMSRLRKKVEPDPANPRHLRTVWSVGYKFVP